MKVMIRFTLGILLCAVFTLGRKKNIGQGDRQQEQVLYRELSAIRSILVECKT